MSFGHSSELFSLDFFLLLLFIPTAPKKYTKKMFVGLVLFRLSRMFHPKVFTLMTLWATFDELECTLLPKHHFTAHFITVSAIFFFFIFFSSPLFLCCFLF